MPGGRALSAGGRSPVTLPALALALAALVLGPGAAAAQLPAISVTRGGTGQLAVDPGRTGSAAFILSNPTDAPVRVTTRVDLPAGWVSVVSGGSLELAPGRDLQLVAFAVPADARAGTYPVRYAVRSPGVAEEAVDSLLVEVRTRHLLRVTRLDAPRYALGGADYVATFRVTNLGNTAVEPRLSVRSSHGLAARPEAGVGVLEPGGSRDLSVRVTTGGGISAPLRHILEVRAAAEGDDASAEPTYASSEVLLVPRRRADPGAYHLPLSLKVRGSRPFDRGAMAELSGGGPIREGGPVLDLMLRQASTGSQMFGERDEYRLALADSSFAATLGDFIYALSPLTEEGRYAIGAGARASVGPWRLKGFVNRNRWLEDGGGEQAASLGHRFGERRELAVNYLRRTGRDAASIWSTRGVLALSRGSTISGEVARGDSPDGRGAGWEATVAGEERGVTYYFRHRWTDPRFPGSYRGAVLDDASFELRPRPMLQVRGRLTRSETDLSRHFGFTSLHVLQSAGLGAGYGESFWVELLGQDRRGRFRSTTFDARERSILLRGARSVGRSRLVGESEFGLTSDRLGGGGTFARLNLRAIVLATGRGSLSPFVEWTVGRRLFLPQVSQRITAGIGSDLLLIRHTRLSLSAYLNLSRGTFRRTDGFLDAAITRELPLGHALELRTRLTTYAAGTASDQNAVLATYSIPLRVPVGRRRSSGRVVGRLYDLESGRGVSDMVVAVGDEAALTDADGRFVFPHLRPDAYALRLEGAGAGDGRIPLDARALEFLVDSGKTLRLDVPVGRGARLVGRVVRYGAERGSVADTAATLREEGGLARVVVSLSGFGTVHRRITDDEGRFEFADLRPGAWTLSLAEGDLPARHRLERDTVPVELVAGGAAEAELRVLPKLRPIPVVDGGVLVSEPE